MGRKAKYSEEIKGYDTKGDVYTMKPKKTTFEERLDIAKWVVANDMDYKAAAEKYSISYARIYKWTRESVALNVSREIPFEEKSLKGVFPFLTSFEETL